MNSNWKRFKRNRLALIGAWIVILLIMTSALAPFLSPYSPNEQNLKDSLKPPGKGHLLGTDYYGRDLLSRIIYGSRISLLVGVTVVLIGMFFGVLAGVISGYFGGIIDGLIMRVTDILLAFPFFLLAIAIAGALGPSLRNGIIALGIATIPSYTRLVRGSVLSIKENEYVAAAQSLGLSSFKIMFKHILPNIFGTLLVYATLRIATAILAEAGLSFLGLGVQPPTPAWGNMLSEGREFLL
ncbi:MAG: ABC transporter permease, partial [Fidelibacterota bacterium]